MGVRTYGSAHTYDRSTRFYIEAILKDRFSHAMAYFSLLERLVTLQNMIRYMILDILSGSTLYIRTGTLYEISMR